MISEQADSSELVWQEHFILKWVDSRVAKGDRL